MSLDQVETEALALPVQERAKLAQRLLESLDALSETEHEALWAEVAQERAAQIDSGAVQLVTAQELEARLEARAK